METVHGRQALKSTKLQEVMFEKGFSPPMK